MRMSVTELLDTARQRRAPLMVLLDLEQSDADRLKVAYDRQTGWFDLPTAAVASITIVEFVPGEESSGLHRVSIELADSGTGAGADGGARNVTPALRETHGPVGRHRPLVSSQLPSNIQLFSVDGASPGALAVAFKDRVAVALTWIPFG
jgi:hypothetical protein